jgi:putative tryptophan/tyrosine transport system substrate-binding protein
MKRREFITLVGAAAAWPLAVTAQQNPSHPRVGVLMGVGESAVSQQWLRSFLEALHQLGWIEGRTVSVEVRWAGGDVAKMRAYASELIEQKCTVILTHATPATLALRSVSGSVMNIFVGASDPIGSGFVRGISRPSTNSSGFTNFEVTVGGKWLELLKEISPQIRNVSMLLNPVTYPGGSGGVHVSYIKAAAPTFEMTINERHFSGVADLEQIYAAASLEVGSAIVVMPDTSTSSHSDLIVQLAARYRVPSIYPYKFFTAAGGLISYGTDLTDVYRRSASYVDRILRGEKPADLPVQTPTKYELVINLKTATALGIDVPVTLLARADDVIE